MADERKKEPGEESREDMEKRHADERKRMDQRDPPKR
jgi:hypothetical protein